MKIPDAGKLSDQIAKCRSDRQKFARAWDLCLLFLQGKQHVKYDRVKQTFVRTGADEMQVTINLIVNIYRNVQARLTLAYPSATVLPASESNEDIIKAKSCEYALKYYWNSDKLKRKMVDAIRWLLTCGNVGMHTKYNGEKVTTEVISPYDLYFEPGLDDPEQCNWIAYAKLVNREELEEAYPNKKDVIKNAADATNSTPGASWFRLRQTSVPKDRVEIYDVYFRSGERRVVLGGSYLFEGEWVGKTMPIQFIRYTPVPGQLWGMGMIEPLLDIQDQYNRVRGQIIENSDLIANPKWMIPKSAGVPPASITRRRGEKVYYNDVGGQRPIPVQMPSLPGYVLQQVSVLHGEMLDVAGVHATSLGKRAVGVTSSVAMQSLANKDSQQLMVTQEDLEEAVVDLSKVVLTLMQKYYTEKRMVRMLDNLGQVVFQSLDSTSLMKDPEVFIEAGSMFRDERQDRDQKVLELVQMGMMQPDEAMKELTFGNGLEQVSEKLQSMAHAQDLLNAAKVGATIEIFPTDDLKSFGEVFGDYIRTEEYYQLPQERQQYIRDIFISVETFGTQAEVQAEALANRKVFPRSAPPEQLDEISVTMESPTSAIQAQMESERMGVMDMNRQMVDEQGPEQGLPTTRMGAQG
jgi:hypothetical protein